MIATSYFEQIESASSSRDLFGDADKARSTYRRLARVVHPDLHPDDKTRAERAFARLTELWNQHNYGPSGVRHPAAPHGHKIYETKRHTYAVNSLYDRGLFSNVYLVTYVPDRISSVCKQGALKIPRSPTNSDLIVNEITTLKTLKKQVPERYRAFHPTTVDSFVHRSPDGQVRRCLITEFLSGFVSLADVQDAYPDGISPRHVAWIARRLWVAMDVAHKIGVVHGAVFPGNVMIHPEKHGVVLIDWAHSRPVGEKLHVMNQKFQKLGWYGRHYDKPLDHRLDVHLAAHTLESLLGEQEARPFRAFFNGCRVASAPTAGELFEEFNALLTRVYGRREFVPFAMPDNWKKEVR